MENDRHIWRVWAGFLQHWGVCGWLASLLEALGPLSILGAQIIYIGQPLLRYALPTEHLEALTRLLEDTPNTRAFANYLREESST
jgi:hypothetical protein